MSLENDGISNRQELANFINQHLGLSPNLQALLAGGFLKLAIPGNRYIQAGTSSLTWPGGSQFSDNITVPHGVPSSPVVQVTLERGATPLLALTISSVGAASFVVGGQTIDGSNPVNTRTDTVHWYAIG